MPHRAPSLGASRLTSDDRLARRATGGDEGAFAAIFDRYHQRLYRFCLAILGDPQEAQDALQNTMVKVLRALPGEKRQIKLKPWLYRIAHNESIELLRRQRETSQLDVELAAPGPGLAEEAVTRERLRGLISDLGELPVRQRATLVMRELAGLDFAEIGAALDTTPATARQTLYEARMSLQKMDEGRAMACESVTRALSDADGRALRRRDVRAHLRSCEDCRRFGEEIEVRERDLEALSPLPALAAAGLLQGLAGGQGAGAGGLGAALGGGAAKTLGASAALKGVATVAAVAVIGVTAADRGGLVHLGPPGDGRGPAKTRIQRSGDLGSPRDPIGPDVAVPQARAILQRLGSARAAGAAGRPTVHSGIGHAGGESTAAPTEPGPTAAHPHGRGHEKNHPDASEKGQETAAAHHAAKQAGGAGDDHVSQAKHPPHPVHPPHPSHPSHPSHPAHPAHPSHPSPEEAPSLPPSSGTTGSEAHATEPSQATPGAEEAPEEPQGGKKP